MNSASSDNLCFFDVDCPLPDCIKLSSTEFSSDPFPVVGLAEKET